MLAGTHSAKEVGNACFRPDFKPHDIEAQPKGAVMTRITKKLTLAAALTLAFATMGAHSARAEDAPAAAEAKPDNEVSFNAAVASDYRYRGISQTRLKPALQGGADYTHNPTGFYAGT